MGQQEILFLERIFFYEDWTNFDQCNILAQGYIGDVKVAYSEAVPLWPPRCGKASFEALSCGVPLLIHKDTVASSFG